MIDKCPICSSELVVETLTDNFLTCPTRASYPKGKHAYSHYVYYFLFLEESYIESYNGFKFSILNSINKSSFIIDKLDLVKINSYSRREFKGKLKIINKSIVDTCIHYESMSIFS